MISKLRGLRRKKRINKYSAHLFGGGRCQLFIKSKGGYINHAKVMKKRRDDLRITQEDLSNLTGISMFRIGQIEREADNLTCNEVALIGKALSLVTVKA